MRLDLLHASGPELLTLQATQLAIAPPASTLTANQVPVQILAYTGGLMFVPPHGWCVVDLQACELSPNHPLLADHQNSVAQVVGQGRSKIENCQILTTGVLTDVTAAGKQILNLHRTGLTFQASVGIAILDRKQAFPGERLQINGQEIIAPSPAGCMVITRSKLREVSLTPLGCDPGTVVTIAARHTLLGAAAMSFEDFVKSLGLDPATITPELRAVLERQFAAQQTPAPGTTPATPPVPPPAAAASHPNRSIVVGQFHNLPRHAPTLIATDGNAVTFEMWLQSQGLDPAKLNDQQTAALQMTYRQLFPNAPPASAPASGDPPPAAAAAITNLRTGMAQELERINQIRQLCASHPSVTVEVSANGQTQAVDLAAHAISQGWTPMQVDNHILRASMPRAPFGIVRNDALNVAVLEASVCRAGGLRDLETHFQAPVIEQSERMFRSGVGLKHMLVLAAQQNGYHGQGLLGFNTDLEGVLRAAFSTNSIRNVLSNVANKFLMQGYNAVESTWQMICKKTPVSDFKQISKPRITGDFIFQKVGKSGELKNVSLGDEVFTNQADTYGRFLGIPRKDIINDDLGALSDNPTKMGRGGALAINRDTWTEFLDNSTFFTTENKNYAEGSGTALSSEAIGQAVQLFDDQTDPDGNPMGLEASILLYPTPLEQTALELVRSGTHTTGGGSTKNRQPVNNVWAGLFEPAKSRYMSNSSYTGYSATAWYLLADPEVEPVIEVVLLNGAEAPVIENAEADFQTLGILLRGYFDYGVNKQSHRGGVKMKGAA